MASGVVLNNLIVPIIYEKVINQDPPTTGTMGYFSITGGATSTEVFNDDPNVVIDQGVMFAGDDVRNPTGPSQSTSGSNNEYLRAGTVNAHDGCELDFVWLLIPGSFVVPQDKLTVYADVDGEGQAGVDIVITGGYGEITDGTWQNHTHFLVAARNVYRDGETIAGYTFFKARLTLSGTDTQSREIRENTGSFAINTYAFKLNKGRDAYLEEQVIPEPEDPPFDPSDDQRYDPFPDNTSDEIPLPSDPAIGVTNAGFINVYKPAINSLNNLGNILFPNPASASDIVDAVIRICETLANQNLINYVIDCHVIPVAPVTGTNSTIKVGYRDTGISVPVVTSDYVNVSCGALNIREYFGGFADYVATRSKIYLPFIGFVDTRPEFWQAGTIAVDYKFNVIDGSFMAYIRSSSSKSQLSNTVIAQYAGNACMHFPLTGVNYSNMVSGIVGAAISTASKGASSLAENALSAANTIASGGDVQQSNGYNSTAAILGVRKPYLMIERAVPSYAAKYMHDKGYPTNITANLANVSGFTIIDDIDLSGIPYTEAELTELKQLLADGVYF